jgi:hypothetical protein
MSAATVPVRSASSDHWLTLRVMAGAAAWVAACVYLRPAPLDAGWGYVLLLFSPLVLVPLGIRLAGPPSWPGRLAEWVQLPAALLLAVSFARPAGVEGALLSMPWLAVTGLVCLEGLLRVLRRGPWPVTELCLDAGLIFLLVGGLWATASRAGMRPLGFDEVVVLLTANHFHYAGFVVPIVAGLCGRSLPGRFSAVTAVGVLAGVPLVAAGITVTKLEGPKLLECVAALTMASSGVGVALMHLRLSARSGPALPRVLWAVAGTSLVLGMILAALYAVRFTTGSDDWKAFPYLTIPWMRLLHGSVNVIGFALAATLGWRLADVAVGEGNRTAPPADGR